MTNLSREHIARHLIDFTAASQAVGYHGGLSLNVHAGLLAEPYETVLEALDGLVKTGIANPFGCAITMCPIWYMKGISRDWLSYGGNSYGISRVNGRTFLEYTDVYNEAKQLAAKYPGKGFQSADDPTVEELVRVRLKLSLPIVLERQSEEYCLICRSPAAPITAPGFGPAEELDYDDDEPDYEPEFDEDADPRRGGDF